MDIDNDGFGDVISGSWPGEIFLFKGGPDHTFAAPEMLKYKDGEIINIGGGLRKDNITMDGRNFSVIAGSTRQETTSEGRFMVYHGKKFKITDENPIATTGTASTADLADWDGDGDYDLIIGDIGGGIYLIPNEGTTKAYAFGKEQQIAKVASRAGPYAADWDGDGDLDLLAGAEDGSVSLFRNTGSAAKPELAAALQLVPPGEYKSGAAASKEVRRGTRSKICVADWNGDGKLDLLVGDFACLKVDLPEPSAEEKAEQEKIRNEYETTLKNYQELAKKLSGSSQLKTQEEIDKTRKEMDETRKKMSDLYAKLPKESENHGWVWLFLRKEV